MPPHQCPPRLSTVSASPGTPEPFCSFPHPHRCLQRLPSTVDYVIAGSSKRLNWLGTFNCRVQTEEVTSPLSSGLVSWKSSQGWGFSNPWACSHPWQNILHSPAPRNFGVPWPLANLWQNIKKKNNGIINKVLRTVQEAWQNKQHSSRAYYVPGC